MTKRGRVLRDTNAGPGLLVIDGIHHTFGLENLWVSDVPPRVGMPVDVQFDAEGSLKAVAAVSESVLAREQANQALDSAKRHGNEIAQSAVKRFGMATLVGFGSLIIGWFFLPTIKIAFPGAAMSFTFWQLLPYVNSASALSTIGPFVNADRDGGVFSLLAILSLAGPFVSYVWHDKRASLGGLLPLLLMLLSAFVFRRNVISAAETAGRDIGDQAVKIFLQHVTFGIGAYVSLACCLYFAFMAVRRYLIASA